MSFVASFAVRFYSTTGIPFGRNLHGFGKGARKIRIKVNHSSDVVVKLPNKANVSAEIVRDLGLVILVYLIDEYPVLIQDVLDLNKAFLKRLQDLVINLCTVAETRECVSFHVFFFYIFFVGVKSLIESEPALHHGRKEDDEKKEQNMWNTESVSTYFFNLSIIISFYVYLPALTKTERQNISSFGIV